MSYEQNSVSSLPQPSPFLSESQRGSMGETKSLGQLGSKTKSQDTTSLVTLEMFQRLRQEVETSRNKSSSEINSLRKEVEDSKNDNEQYKSEIKSLRKEVADSKNDNEQYKSEIRSLKQIQSSQGDEIQRLKGVSSEKDNIINTLSQKVLGLKDELLQTKEERDDARSANRNLMNRLKAVQPGNTPLVNGTRSPTPTPTPEPLSTTPSPTSQTSTSAPITKPAPTPSSPQTKVENATQIELKQLRKESKQLKKLQDRMNRLKQNSQTKPPPRQKTLADKVEGFFRKIGGALPKPPEVRS